MLPPATPPTGTGQSQDPAPLQVINFFGAPGAGKTTAWHGLCHELKKRWVNVEACPEFAKEMVLNDAAHLLSQQLWILAEQEMRLNRLRGRFAAAVSDAPLLLSLFYAGAVWPRSFRALVFDLFERYANTNIVVRRSHVYDPSGRIQSAEQADCLGDRLERFLQDAGIEYHAVAASDANPVRLADWLRQRGVVTFDTARWPAAPVPEGWIHSVTPPRDDRRRAAMLDTPYLNDSYRTVGDALRA